MKTYRNIDLSGGGGGSPFEQEINVQTIIKLDFVDALKVLFGRAIRVKTRISVPQEQQIESYHAHSETTIVPTSTHFVKQDKPQFGYSPKE